MDTTEKTRKAFARIHDETAALLRLDDVPENIREGLKRIQSVSRFYTDVLPPLPAGRKADDDG